MDVLYASKREGVKLYCGFKRKVEIVLKAGVKGDNGVTMDQSGQEKHFLTRPNETWNKGYSSHTFLNVEFPHVAVLNPYWWQECPQMY